MRRLKAGSEDLATMRGWHVVDRGGNEILSADEVRFIAMNESRPPRIIAEREARLVLSPSLSPARAEFSPPKTSHPTAGRSKTWAESADGRAEVFK